MNNVKQTPNFKKENHILKTFLSFNPHRTINTSCGMIPNYPLHISKEEVLENLAEQSIILARRIKIYRQKS